MKEIVNYIKEDQNFSIKFGANKKNSNYVNLYLWTKTSAGAYFVEITSKEQLDELKNIFYETQNPILDYEFKHHGRVFVAPFENNRNKLAFFRREEKKYYDKYFEIKGKIKFSDITYDYWKQNKWFY